MGATAIAERIYKRKFHSEADRQELIGNLSQRIERAIYADIQSDEAEAEEIAMEAFGAMSEEKAAKIIQWALSGDIAAPHMVRKLLIPEIDAAITRTAELRAIRAVEVTEPHDFEI